MATLSNISVSFDANTSKFTEGLSAMQNKSRNWARGVKKDGDSAAQSLLGSLRGMNSALGLFGASLSVGALIAFGNSVTKMAGELTDLSANFGISTKRLQQMESALADGGITTEDTVKMMKALSKAIEDASSGNAKLEETFNKLGLSASDLKGLSIDEAFKVVATSVARTNDQSLALNASMELLSKTGPKVIGAFKEINEKGGFDKVVENVYTNSEIAVAALDAFSDSLSRAWLNLRRFSLEALGQGLSALQSTQPSAPANLFNLSGVKTTPSASRVPDILEGIKRLEAEAARETEKYAAEKQAADAQRLLRWNKMFKDAVDINVDTFESAVREQRVKAEEFASTLDPVKKYALEIQKIRSLLQLSPVDRGTAIRNLAGNVRDLIDPSQRYYDILINLNALEKNRIITSEEAGKALLNLRDSYRSLQLGDELARINLQVREINSLPGVFLGDEEKGRAIKRLGDEYRAILNPTFKYIKEEEKLNALLKVGAISAEEYAKVIEKLRTERDLNNISSRSQFLTGATRAAYDYAAAVMGIKEAFNGMLPDDAINKLNALKDAQLKYFTETQPYLTGIMQNFGENLSNGFADALLGARSFQEGMHDVLMSLSRDIVNVIIKQYILKSLFNAVGTSIFGIPEMGQLMYGGPRASGGPVKSNTAYMVGEEGAELFVPNRSGYVIPNDMIGGGGTTIVQNINVQTGVAQTVRSEMMNLLPRFKQEAVLGVLEAKQRGGTYSRALA